MIAVIDYGVGNLGSILNMLKKIGVDGIVTSDYGAIKEADKYILPGVGSFDYAINRLRAARFFELLSDQVLIHKKPILGICLGMQLLTLSSEEGNERGLGWIPAETLRFNFFESNLAIPHMGWNNLKVQSDCRLFHGLLESRFYFVHSYFVKCKEKYSSIATAHYGQDFTCAISNGNIYGVQFHPEKSHKFGMKLLKNFGDL